FRQLSNISSRQTTISQRLVSVALAADNRLGRLGWNAIDLQVELREADAALYRLGLRCIATALYRHTRQAAMAPHTSNISKGTPGVVLAIRHVSREPCIRRRDATTRRSPDVRRPRGSLQRPPIRVTCCSPSTSRLVAARPRSDRHRVQRRWHLSNA